ncbi:TMEM175 family protein [Sphingomonas sp. URHD0057]|uniref:TMEM175 family protein n=1 Tax=Sphingomonas sp. URHD0057 TaxID=1380389 RepID=UPI00048E15B0|nr:TMEM175 family protein [Sphingomonas sp. URHD0057]
MKPDRLNAFTDGVIAIIITIMVLEMRVPEGTGLAALRPELPIFGAYVLSFIYVGIYWNNHHHMMQTAKRVDGRVLWSNLGLLFWLSLFPFVIRWIDERGVTSFPVAAFGVVLTMASISYLVLEKALIAAEGESSGVAEAVGSRMKEWLSFILYVVGSAAAFLVSPWLSIALYMAVAVIWLVPDRRFERKG